VSDFRRFDLALARYGRCHGCAQGARRSVFNRMTIGWHS
jgi:hypothetical protein